MSTNLDLITGSLRLCKVLGETDTASAEQGSIALPFLNRMMETWTESGIELGWFEQSSTSATAPVPKWSEQGIISKLSQVLSGVYDEAVLPRWAWDDKLNGYGMILRKCMLEAMETADMDHMPLGSGSRGNILTGE